MATPSNELTAADRRKCFAALVRRVVNRKIPDPQARARVEADILATFACSEARGRERYRLLAQS